eukprot:300421-Prorocentrum_minimum.AAC.1
MTSNVGSSAIASGARQLGFALTSDAPEEEQQQQVEGLVQEELKSLVCTNERRTRGGAAAPRGEVLPAGAAKPHRRDGCLPRAHSTCVIVLRHSIT